MKKRYDSDSTIATTEYKNKKKSPFSPRWARNQKFLMKNVSAHPEIEQLEPPLGRRRPTRGDFYDLIKGDE